MGKKCWQNADANLLCWSMLTNFIGGITERFIVFSTEEVTWQENVRCSVQPQKNE